MVFLFCRILGCADEDSAAPNSLCRKGELYQEGQTKDPKKSCILKSKSVELMDLRNRSVSFKQSTDISIDNPLLLPAQRHGSQRSYLLQCSEKAKSFGYVDDTASLNDIERSLQARNDNCNNGNSLQTSTADECDGSETIATTPAKSSSHVRLIFGRHCMRYPTKLPCTMGKPALVANKQRSIFQAPMHTIVSFQKNNALPLQRSNSSLNHALAVCYRVCCCFKDKGLERHSMVTRSSKTSEIQNPLTKRPYERCVGGGRPKIGCEFDTTANVEKLIAVLREVGCVENDGTPVLSKTTLTQVCHNFFQSTWAGGKKHVEKIRLLYRRNKERIDKELCVHAGNVPNRRTEEFEEDLAGNAETPEQQSASKAGSSKCPPLKPVKKKYSNESTTRKQHATHRVDS